MGMATLRPPNYQYRQTTRNLSGRSHLTISLQPSRRILSPAEAQRLVAVWSRHLNADSDGPTLIFDKAPDHFLLKWSGSEHANPSDFS